MHLTDLVSASTSCIHLLSICLQCKYNKSNKSTHGLSYDYSHLQFLAHLTLIIGYFSFDSSSSSSSTTTTTVTSQYRIRWSSDPPPVPRLILIFDALSFMMSIGVLVQLAMYKPTRGRQQGGGGGGGGGISRYFLGFTIVVFAPFIYLVKLRHFKQATINELDLADYVLVIYKIFDAVKLYPQVMVNWMEDSTSGLHPYWLHLQLLSMLVEIIARVALMWTPWADVSSLLLPSWLLVPFKIVSLGIIAVQYYTYRTKQPDIHYKEV